MKLINPHVRVIPRIGRLSGSYTLILRLLALPRRWAVRARGGRRWADEWVRCFGAARFDHVVDFSGYSAYWIELLRRRPSGSLAIWLHNDIAAELANRERSLTLRLRLRGATRLYSAADQLVSVSRSLGELNRASLAGSAAPERFRYAHNTIRADRIRTRAADGDAIEAGGGPVFVTAGRLSREKNHERLIRAFAAVHAEQPGVRLVIMGDGPLRQRLTGLAGELDLTGAVTLAGHVANPYPTLAAADCFVLSSDYEGQPMVLLEALVLGLPVVCTAFASAPDALPEGHGILVERSVDALADGLRAFLRGAVPHRTFDAETYNRRATDEFYAAIDAVSPTT